MNTITTHLEAARTALLEARELALAESAAATYRLAEGRFTPLTEAAQAVARVDDLLHLTTRLISHGTSDVSCS